MAFNILLVTAVMIRVLYNSFMSFKTSIIATAAVAAKQRETELLSTENARLAHTDALTGLPNRRYFFSELGRRLADAKKSGSRLSVGVLDLDRFKPVNDTFGHALGDRLLAAVGDRLLHNVDTGTVVARLGGDEFGLIIPADIKDVQGLGAVICEALGGPYEVDGHSVTIGCSGGFASFPEAGTTVHELFDRSITRYTTRNRRPSGVARFFRSSTRHASAPIAHSRRRSEKPISPQSSTSSSSPFCARELRS